MEDEHQKDERPLQRIIIRVIIIFWTLRTRIFQIIGVYYKIDEGEHVIFLWSFKMATHVDGLKGM